MALPAVWAQPASGSFCSNSHSTAKPGRKIRFGARCVGALAGGSLLRVVKPLAFNALGRINRWEEAEIHVHWLEGAGAFVRRFIMPARDVIDQSTMGRGCGRHGKFFTQAL